MSLKQCSVHQSYQDGRGGQRSSQQLVQMRSGGPQADLRPAPGPDVQQIHPRACRQPMSRWSHTLSLPMTVVVIGADVCAHHQHSLRQGDGLPTAERHRTVTVVDGGVITEEERRREAADQ